MIRFTRKMPGGYGLVEGRHLGTASNNRAVINRLAAYENCGLDPEDVMRLVLFVQEVTKVLEKKEEVHNGNSQR